jgi:hypothetical protein
LTHPRIIANVRHAWLDECALRATRKKLKFWRWRLWWQEIQTRLWWRLRWGLAKSAFGGILESGGRFCVGAFRRNLASVAVKMFSHLIYFKKKFYKLCTSDVVYKDNAAINCTTVQHKKSSFLSTSTTTPVFKYYLEKLRLQRVNSPQPSVATPMWCDALCLLVLNYCSRPGKGI